MRDHASAATTLGAIASANIASARDGFVVSEAAGGTRTTRVAVTAAAMTTNITYVDACS